MPWESNLPELPRVLITGSREWTDEKARSIMTKRLMRLPIPVTIIHGTCRGADQMADSIARQLGHRVERHPALWDLEGRGAGPKRNLRMLDSGVDLVLSFPWDMEKSRGTRHCTTAAWERKLPIEIWHLHKPVQKLFIGADVHHLTR